MLKFKEQKKERLEQLRKEREDDELS